MDLPRVSRAVRRVTILSPDESGTLVPVVIYNRGRKKKKGSEPFVPIERFVRQVANAAERTTGAYVAGHKKSNRKRRDGWVMDANANAFRAGRKGLKALDPGRLFSF